MCRLPPPIPEDTYRRVEHALTHRAENRRRALDRLARAEQEAYDVHGPNLDRVGSGGGSQDRVERAALKLAHAREAADAARSWDKVYRLCMETYQGTCIAQAARMLIDEKLSQAETARKLMCTRQTVRRYKDDFIYRCAVLAVQFGILKIVEDDEHDQL